MRTKIALTTLLVFLTNFAEGRCPYFMFPAKHTPSPVMIGSDCQSEWPNSDIDGDGTKDWQQVSTYGNVVMPADDDIDGDGIENFLDPEPFIANEIAPDLTKVLPFHITEPLDGHPKSNWKKIKELQKSIYAEHGVVVGHLSSNHSLMVLQALKKVLSALNITQKHRLSSKLRYVLASGQIAGKGSHGYYIEPIRTILLPGAAEIPSHWNEKNITELVAHEVGHAMVFGYLAPETLAKLAEKEGGWQHINHENDFYSFAMRKTPRSSSNHKGYVPSSYASKNAHEWFAEVFSAFVSERVYGFNQLPDRLRQRVAYLIK